MISGIPYFGENTQSLYKMIKNFNFSNSNIKTYKSLYSALESLINRRIIVIIDNKWLTWLNDIIFNYRDKCCYLPYFSYKKHIVNDKEYHNDNKGHLIISDGALHIRYEYKYAKLSIDGNNLLLNCVDIDTFEHFVLSTHKWIDETECNFDKLYNLYLESAYTENDYNINKHAGGYHYIDRSPKQFKNKEKVIREQLGLSSYSLDNIIDADYRDVRNFKYNEIIQKHGMLQSVELYRERRLRFESYLYCCIRQGLLDSLEFRKGIYKYGDTIKLIIKDYWILDKDRPNKTWCK